VKAKAHVAHSIPGRTRFRIHERRGDHAFFDEIAEVLRRCAGVTAVKSNPLTGSLLLHHSDDLDSPLMQAALGAIDELVELELSAPPVARQLREDVIGVDQAIQRLSGGQFDLGTVTAFGLLGLAGAQLLAGQHPAIAITLAWYATELIRRWEEPHSNRVARRGSDTKAQEPA
jgi:hypothetical protein